MLQDIFDVRAVDGHQLRLRFEDGVEGVVDVAKLVNFAGVFAPLADREFFEKVPVNAELGTLVWPNGADLDPDVLYAEITGDPIATARFQSTRL